jgi:hypothetical protein
MLQVFHLFRTYVGSVSSGYCKSRSSVVHVTVHVKSRGGARGLAASACVGARKAGADGNVLALARAWSADTRGNRVQREHSSERPDACTAAILMGHNY